MATLGDLVIRLGVNPSGLGSGLARGKSMVASFIRNVKYELSKIDSMFGGVGGGILNMLRSRAAGVAALLAGTFTVGSAIAGAREQIAAETKLSAVLRATGGAAQLSATQIKDYASSLQDVTNFGDDTTINSAALLATFREIRGDVFTESLGLIQDMATVMETDLKGPSIQVGKALNDPIKGKAALGEVGVSFSAADSAAIERLQKAGDIVGAQRIILKELKSEFGGAATAMADPFTQIWNIAGDVGEMFVGVFLPVTREIAKSLSDWSKPILANSDSFKMMGESLAWAYRNGSTIGQLALVELAIRTNDLLDPVVSIRQRVGANFSGLFAAVSTGANTMFSNFKAGLTDLGTVAKAFSVGIHQSIKAGFAGEDVFAAFDRGMKSVLSKAKPSDYADPAAAMQSAFTTAFDASMAQSAMLNNVEDAALVARRAALTGQLISTATAIKPQESTSSFGAGLPVEVDDASDKPTSSRKDNNVLARGSAEAFKKILSAGQTSPNKKLEDLAAKQLEAIKIQTETISMQNTRISPQVEVVVG